MTGTNVMYSIKSAVKTVIGNDTTLEQMIKNRMSGHRSDFRRRRSEKSALEFHAVENNHELNFECVEILAHNKNDNKRMMMEDLYIKSSKTSVNKKSVKAANVSLQLSI